MNNEQGTRNQEAYLILNSIFTCSLFDIPCSLPACPALLAEACAGAVGRFGIHLCGWRDSNPHALRRQILSLVCLPISPHPLICQKVKLVNRSFHIDLYDLLYHLTLKWAANVAQFTKRKRLLLLKFVNYGNCRANT